MNRYRFTAFLLVIVMLLSIAGCAKKNAVNTGSHPSSPAESLSSEPTVSEPNGTPSVPEDPTEVLPTPTPTPTPTPSPSPSPSPTPTPSPSDGRDPEFDKTPTGVFSLTLDQSALSVGSLVLANSSQLFTSSLKPELALIHKEKTGMLATSIYNHFMHMEAVRALDAMEIAFRKETGSSLTFLVTSSWPYNAANEILKDDPTAKVVTTSDEHYTGYAVDLKFWDPVQKVNYPLNYSAFGTEVSWLAKNAARFGYVVRYPANKVDQTGMAYDFGHYRYVGVAHACYMDKYGLCLEEYLEEVKKYNADNRLVVTDFNGNRWSVYYTAAEGQSTSVSLPKGVSYEISGNNKDGYIVAVKSVWDGNLTEMPDAVPVDGITTAAANIELALNETLPLAFTVSPENATNKKVSFSSSDTNVVKVENGTLLPVSVGTATVTVTTVDGGFTVEITVNVVDKKVTTVWIDPGHGCYNSKGVLDVGLGADTPFYTVSGGLYESDLNMLVAETLKSILESKGYKVLMTRSGDRMEYLSAAQRAEEANAAGADLFISIHANAISSPSVAGAEVHHASEHPMPDASEALNQAICNAINAAGCSASTVKPSTDDSAVLTAAKMPAVLVETCYLTNAQDAEKAITAEWCNAMATAIATGVAACYPAE